MGYCLLILQEAESMKLTVEQVSKLTKLSVPTLRVYASRQKLGKKEGNKRYFSQDDVKKLLKGSSAPAAKKAPAKKTKPVAAKKPARKPAQKTVKKPAKKPAKRTAKVTVKTAQPSPVTSRPEPVKPQVQKKSFWSFLRRKPQQKVTLMDAKGLPK
jgi:DNA-binding transcriptional MerR regulator